MERLRTLFEASPDPMFLKDGEGRWLEVNPAAIELFELQGIDYRRKTDLELAELQPAYRDALVYCKGSDEVAWAKERTSRAEETIPRSDGSVRVFDVIKVPLFAPDGRRRGLVVLGRDITERRRAEQERDGLLATAQAARAEAESHFAVAQRAVQLREEFIGIAAHELRTPLTTLQLTCRSLAKSAAPKPGPPLDIGRLARIAERQVERLTRLVEDVLELSRIRAGRIEIQPEPLDLVEAVRTALGELQEVCDDAGCPVAFEASGPVRGAWDRMGIERITVNLISNAAKFGRGKPIEISVRAEASAGVISVRDHGIGIAAGDLARIFEMFERAVSMRQYGGLGLGLYIVRGLAEAHGGTVSAESRVGEGTRVTVSLPSRQPAAQSRS
ncbi:MAG: PAS domain-containing sensor histidine kinase [Myxococcales bacterium]